jgi:DNA polymerase-1
MKPNHFPWMEDYHLVCIGLIPSWKEVDISEVLWDYHSEMVPTPRLKERIQELVDEADIVAAHNMKYDMCLLRHLGVDFSKTKLHCTMVSDYLINAQQTNEYRFSLDAVSKRRGLPPKLDEVKAYWKNNVDTYDIPHETLIEYVMDDTVKVDQMAPQQLKEISELGLDKVYNIQMEFIHTLVDIEYNGFLWDLDLATAQVEQYKDLCDSLTTQLLEFTPEKRLNLSSNDQLSVYLYGGTTTVSWREWRVEECKSVPWSYYKHKLFTEEVTLDGLGFTPLPKTEAKKPGFFKTNKETIKLLRCVTPEQRKAKKILGALSKASKVLETLKGKKEDSGLSNKVAKDGCIHPRMNQTVTVTGRLSSSNPNSQNLPRGGTSPIKRCVIPRNDGIMQFDLSQIEWRAAAWLSQDPIMIHEINNGIDQHIAACKDPKLLNIKFVDKADPESKKNRNHAKTFNFRMIYGGSYYGFYMDNNMPSFSKKRWKGVVDGFYNKYSGLKDWQDSNISHVYRSGGLLDIPTGRRFKFPAVPLRDGGMGYDERKIKNYPVQGISGGDILPLCSLIIRRGMARARLSSPIILSVHDSIVFDYLESERERLARLCMLTVRDLPRYISEYFGVDWNVALDGEIEIGPNYGELNELKVEV